MEILRLRPGSLPELSRISGVGQAKLVRYGEAFLQVLSETDDAI